MAQCVSRRIMRSSLLVIVVGLFVSATCGCAQGTIDLAGSTSRYPWIGALATNQISSQPDSTLPLANLQFISSGLVLGSLSQQPISSSANNTSYQIRIWDNSTSTNPTWTPAGNNLSGNNLLLFSPLPEWAPFYFFPGFNFTWSLDFNNSHAVPEPSTYALLALSSLAWLAVCRRQTRVK